MTTRLITVPTLALAVLAIAPAAAQAVPQIQVDRDCYLDTVIDGSRVATPVALSGNGFTPNAEFQVNLDGTPLPNGTGTMDGLGALSGKFTATPLATLNRRQKQWTVRVDEGANTATTTFFTSDIFADFTPASGNPAKLKVNWVANGFKLAQADTSVNPSVYLHYIRPNRKRKVTVKLGTATGPCGELKKTKKRKLFPFKAERGLWQLQVDTNKKFKRGTSKSTFTYYTVGVRIRTVFG